MKTADVIHRKVKELPEEIQAEVLDFVEFVAARLRREDSAWSQISLAAALKGMEDEDWPQYTDADLREKWR